LPAQTEADYEDLTHVNPAAQSRFSEAIARLLQKLGQTQHHMQLR
jgi:lysophospholipase L1-like esterase